MYINILKYITQKQSEYDGCTSGKKSAEMSLLSLLYGIESRILIKVPLKPMQFFPFIGSAKIVMKDISFCTCPRHHIKGIWQA